MLLLALLGKGFGPECGMYYNEEIRTECIPHLNSTSLLPKLRSHRSNGDCLGSVYIVSNQPGRLRRLSLPSGSIHLMFSVSQSILCYLLPCEQRFGRLI